MLLRLAPLLIIREILFLFSETSRTVSHFKYRKTYQELGAGDLIPEALNLLLKGGLFSELTQNCRNLVPLIEIGNVFGMAGMGCNAQIML